MESTMKPDFFTANRKRLAQTLKGGIVVVTANGKMQLSADVTAPFKQESNFYYLSGISEPNWQIILDSTRGKSWLVSPKLSESTRIFEGGISDSEAQDVSGVNEVINEEQADILLRDLARQHSTVYALGRDPHSKYYDFTLNPAPGKLWQKLERIFTSVTDLRPDIERLRAIKQPEEIASIKKAIKITTDAFEMVKQNITTYKYEYEVEAEFTYQFRRKNSVHAYEPIVAAGTNANTLHYVESNSRLRKGNLLLLDIGASVDGYAADITRTYACGDASARSQRLHEVLQGAHKDIIKLLRPDLPVATYLDKVDDIMKQALIGLKLIDHPGDEKYRTYFPHAISHGLGLDVHDSLGRPKEFAPNMVLTVEPGIYVPEWGVGARIEDDILITDTGADNLSKKLDISL